LLQPDKSVSDIIGGLLDLYDVAGRHVLLTGDGQLRKPALAPKQASQPNPALADRECSADQHKELGELPAANLVILGNIGGKSLAPARLRRQRPAVGILTGCVFNRQSHRPSSFQIEEV